MHREKPIINVIPFPDEITHLEEMNHKLSAALKNAEANVDRADKEYKDAKRYMAEYRGELDPNEMFQNELLLKQTDHTGVFAVSILHKLSSLKESPYFARIDFQCRGSKEAEAHYIGRFSFSYKNELLISDWRAPIASMFYDDKVGLAGYDSPMGRINGKLTRKRQFKIKNAILEYAIESSEHVQDDILQKELSHTSDEKMKSIIGTIQREQNKIIRNENSGTLIIQGAAGSGKTSIALHRIAFLLYRYRDKLSSRNVAILSPNKVFGDYISNVIPELGEEPIYQLSFHDIAEIELAHVIGFEQDKDPQEIQDEQWKERVRFKSTLEFVKLMDQYISDLPQRIFLPVDNTLGSFTVNGDWIRKRLCAYGKYPLKQRLPMVADDIYRRFQSENIMEDDLPGKRAILKSLNDMLQFKSTLAIYKDFYASAGASGMFLMPGKKTLEWTDVFPFLYLHAFFEGIKTSAVTKHLVIDEMQDYTPIQYAVMNRLFPCQKTILGDFGQSLNPCCSHSLGDIRKLYEGAEFVELNKSYRSTYEIITFAKSILNIPSLEPVERHGAEPSLTACKDLEEEIRNLKSAVQDFRAGGNASLGILLKTNKEAKAFYDLLSGEADVNLVSPESTSFTGGISVISIRMAKGLEFDQVMIPQAGSKNYCSDYDRNLLYIACTRAMHRLTLSCTGEPSRLLPPCKKIQ